MAGPFLPMRPGINVPRPQMPVGGPMPVRSPINGGFGFGGGPAAPVAPVMPGANPGGFGGQPAPMRPPVLGSFKRGGKVKKTGNYRLHKGERVVPLSSLRRAK